MTARCDLTELLTTDCAHCRNSPDPFAKPAAPRGNGTPGPVIAARYAGKCACGERFDEGDPIRADGDGDWLAACCNNIDD